MPTLQKAGGYGALVEASAYLVGFGVMATALNPGNTAGRNAAERLAFALARKDLFQAWTRFVHVLGGLALAVLAAALARECGAETLAAKWERLSR